MPVTLDMMEYADDAAAQAAYVTSATYSTFGKTAKGGTEVVRSINQINACKFTSGPAGTLKSLKVYLKYKATNVNVKCAIYDSSFNLLTNGTTEAKVVTSGQDGWMEFNFSTAPAVAASTVYYLAFWTDAELYDYHDAGPNQEAYDGLTYGSWPDPLVPDGYQDRDDSIYAIYVEIDLQCYSESIIKQQGSYSLKGIAKATDSLNDTLTRTIASPIDLSNQNAIEFDIRASRTGSNIKIGIRDSGGTVTEVTPNILSVNTWQRVRTCILSTVPNENKDAIDRIIVTIVNADSDNTFYLDNMFAGIGVISEKKLGLVPSQISKLYGTGLIKLGFVKSMVAGPLGLLHELKLGFVPSHTSEIYGTQTSKLGLVPHHSSEIYGILLKKLGLVPSHSSVTHGALLEKLGFIPSHSSTTFGTHALKLGFAPSHTSIVFGLLIKGLGFVPIHEAKVYKFIVELKFYDRDDKLIRIISSKTQNFPLISPGLEFEFLQDGGCGFFDFTTSEDLGLDYNYKCEIYLYEEKWFTGYITKLPKIGTATTYEYRGWGYFEQIDWQTIKETYVGDELSVIAEDILDKYIVPYTDVKKGA